MVDEEYADLLCKWTYDEEDESWDTECNGGFILESGTPQENDFEF